jgi:glycosyltransferase involved in cell wall biosynthesis
MVMIEAMACGTPVIATPMGAVNEIVDDGVTGFVRASPGDLALAVVAAGELDRLACRQLAADRFSIARMAEDHVRLYESVTGAHPAPVRVA